MAMSKQLYCNRCDQQKEVEMFHNNKSTITGKSTYCKSCVAEYMKSNKYKYQKKYHKETDKTFPIRRKNYYIKNKDCPVFKLKRSLSTTLSRSIRENMNFGKKKERIFGCNLNQLREYISSQFNERMSFDNYGEWQIDHIVPLSEADTIEKVVRLNHYTNLQPLFKKDHLHKTLKEKGYGEQL